MKNEEIRELSDRLNELLAQLDRSQEDKAGLERVVQGLNDVKMSQKTEISKLVEDNKKLSKICQEQDRSMKLSEQERQKLASKLDETNYDLKNLSGQLRSREENLNFTQGQLEENKNLNMKLQATIKDYERQFDNMRNDIDGLKDNLMKEKQCRNEEEKRGEQLEGIIQERERELNRLGNDIENMKVLNQRINDDKMNGEINRKNRLLLRKNRIKQIQKKYNAEIEQEVQCKIINQNKCKQSECNDKENQIQNKESKEKEDKAPSSSSSSDMFEFSDTNSEHNKKKNVIDLGLTSKNESIGYYIPQVNEIIYNKYKVIGLCGKGIFSSVFNSVEICSSLSFMLPLNLSICSFI